MNFISVFVVALAVGSISATPVPGGLLGGLDLGCLLDGVLGAVQNLVNQVLELVGNLLNGLGLDKLLGGLGENLNGLLGAVDCVLGGELIGNLADTIQELLNNILCAVLAIVDKLIDAVQDLIEKAKPIVDKLLCDIQKALRKLLATLKKTLNCVADKLNLGCGNPLGDLLTAVIAAVASAADDLIEKLRPTVQELLDNLWCILENLQDSIRNSLNLDCDGYDC